MESFDRDDQLGDDEARRLHIETASLAQMREQFAASHVLCKHVHVDHISR